MISSLSRKDNHRRSLIRNLATSLILYEEIKTTKAKGKAVLPIIERWISQAKKNNLAVRRKLLGYFFDKNAVKKIFEVLLPRFKNISSGFVKIYQIGPRLGDSAPMVILKLQEGDKIPPVVKEDVKKDKDDTKKEKTISKGKPPKSQG